MNKTKYIFTFIFDPVFICAWIIMLFNDFYLKPSLKFPLLAGKLSDFAILTFLPSIIALAILYLKLIINLIFKKNFDVNLNKKIIISSILIAGVLYSLIKISPLFNGLFFTILNKVNILKPFFPLLGGVIDSSDLIALPFLFLSYLRMKGYVKE